MHNVATQGGKFAIAACYGEAMVGVAIVGRPVSAQLQDGVIYGGDTGLCLGWTLLRIPVLFCTGDAGAFGNRWAAREW